ncbi:DUF262 domain-containing protein [bacterium]|nr:DUF262 domain-containing protein [bacterium]
MSNSKENFTSKPEDFEGIIDNSKRYIVPRYQRDYTWDNKNDEWELLWDDITSKDKQHYVGILVLQELEDKINIIDGQQRLTTITIIILAALYLLAESIEKMDASEQVSAKKQLELLLNSYIARQNPKDLKYYGKIILNKNNNEFFSQLCDINQNKSVLNIKTKSKELKSNKLLCEALKYFYIKLKDYISIINADTIIDFIDEKINKKLIFNLINVSSTENAYMLFETLNSRAVELSAYDLLKNHLLSKAGTEAEESMLSDIEKITTNIEDDDITRFIALDWNSRYIPKTPEKRIYRKISNTITDSRSAFTYTKKLIKSSEIYKLIKSPDFDDKNINELLKVLNYIPRIKQHYMILLSLLQSNNKNYNKKKIIQALLILALRYNYVGQGQANRQESVYNTIAHKISQEKYKNTKEIFEEIKNSNIYVKSAEFIEKFSTKDFATEKLDRYILAKIQEEFNSSSIKIDYDNMTIEHIKDKSSDAKYKNKIGNFLLLKEEINSSMSTMSFEEKKEIYKKYKTLPFLNDIINSDIWSEKEVENRSKKLAKMADKIFSLKELEEKD